MIDKGKIQHEVDELFRDHLDRDNVGKLKTEIVALCVALDSGGQVELYNEDGSYTPVAQNIWNHSRDAAIRECVKVIDNVGTEWGDQARARRSRTYSAYVFAALDLQGRLTALATSIEKGQP